MQRERVDVGNALVRKGFEKDDRHHHMFYYRTVIGKKTAVRTRTSHSGKTLDSVLLGQMAKQCKLTMADFLQLVDCSLSREAFEERILLK